MSSSSDTESEAEGNSQQSHPSDTFSVALTVDTQVTSQDARAALERLIAIDVEALAEDRSMDEAVSEVYTALARFLQQLCDRLSSLVEDHESALKAFATLVDTSSMRALFVHRALCHRLAAGSAANSAGSGGVVSWVDDLLARLQEATIAICTGLRADTDTPGVQTQLKVYQNEQLVRAAAQLPHNFDEIIKLVDSDHASAASKRIILTLSFANIVLAPQILGNPPDGALFSTAHDHLGEFLVLAGGKHLDDPAASELPDREKISYAMAIVLYAETSNQEEEQAFQPHTNLRILLLLQKLMNASTSSDSVAPMEELDVAQTVLIRWAQVIPWTWRTWSDSKATEQEVLVLMYTTWLYYLNRPLYGEASDKGKQQLELPENMFEDLGHVDSISLRFLHQFIYCYEKSNQISQPLSRVLHRACLVICEVRRRQDEDHYNTLVDEELAVFLTRVYVLLKEDGGDASEAKELIIESLVRLEPDARSKGLKKAALVTERFSSKVAHVASRCKSALSAYKDEQDLIHASRSMRRCINFLSVLWRDSIDDEIIARSIQSTLFSLISLLAHEKPDGTLYVFLKNAMLVCVGVYEAHPSASRTWKPDLVWQLSPHQTGGRLLSQVCFAQMILGCRDSPFTCNPVLCLQAWSELRDVLFLILLNKFLGDEELLAVAASSTICRAMMKLLTHSPPGAALCMMQSITFIILRNELRRFLSGELKKIEPDPETREYLELLHQKMEETGRRFLWMINEKISLFKEPCPEMSEAGYGWALFPSYDYQALCLLEKN